jgi:hypothetical protein
VQDVPASHTLSRAMSCKCLSISSEAGDYQSVKDSALTKAFVSQDFLSHANSILTAKQCVRTSCC